jgi:hypothetical protein
MKQKERKGEKKTHEQTYVATKSRSRSSLDNRRPRRPQGFARMIRLEPLSKHRRKKKKKKKKEKTRI